MKNIKIIFRFLFAVVIIANLTICCKDKYEFVDYEKLEKEELKLLERFYESDYFKTFLDSTKNIIGKETIVYKNQVVIAKDSLLKGFCMIRTYRDAQLDSVMKVDSILKQKLTIKIGQTVGFRYTFSYLDVDENDEFVEIILYSNLQADEPDIYSAGNYNSYGYGIDLGIRNMILGDKCTMIIPSSFGARYLLSNYSTKDQFKIIIADIKITYCPIY